MKKLLYQIHLKPEPSGGFTVTVPALPGCMTWGVDYDHAIARAREVIQDHIAVLAREGMPVPEEDITSPVDTLIQVESSAVV